MAEPHSTIIIFELAETRYGIAASSVSEVLPAVMPTELPDAPQFVDGVFNLRGQIVAIICLRRVFKLGERIISPDQYLLVSQVMGLTAALRVDHVCELATIRSESIERAKLVVGEAAYLSGVVRVSDGLILIHDLGTLLTKPDREAIDRAIASAGEVSPNDRIAV